MSLRAEAAMPELDAMPPIDALFDPPGRVG
jgi:hypothetical protein